MSEVASGINLDKFDTLIRRRHEKRVTSEGERLAEALYQESVRRHNLARHLDGPRALPRRGRRMFAYSRGIGYPGEYEGEG